jgi:hypothetical protein
MAKQKKALKPGIGWAWTNGIRVSSWSEPTEDRLIREDGPICNYKKVRVAIVPLTDYRRMVKELKELKTK